jgi:CheY-like chemotaxis protein
MSRTLLIVDDDFSNRTILRHFLSYPHWNVDDAESGFLALQKMAEKNYDFVFLDIEMPVMDGFEVARRMRALELDRNPGGEHVMIIALSSHDDPSIRKRALQAGCDQYLTKPVTRTVIADLVRGSKGVIVLDEDMRHLVPPFLEKQMEEIVDVRKGVALGDNEAVRRAGHRMRGSFGLYGFHEAASICGEMEELAQANRLADAGKRLSALSAYLDEIDVHYCMTKIPEA